MRGGGLKVTNKVCCELLKYDTNFGTSETNFRNQPLKVCEIHCNNNMCFSRIYVALSYEAKLSLLLQKSAKARNVSKVISKHFVRCYEFHSTTYCLYQNLY